METRAAAAAAVATAASVPMTPMVERIVYRPQSPTDRPFNCPKRRRDVCLHDGLGQKCSQRDVRKTQSTAFPNRTNARRLARLLRSVETSSTPDLRRYRSDYCCDEAPAADNRRNNNLLHHYDRRASCSYNILCLCVFFNADVLIFSIMHFGSALTFSLSSSIFLLTMSHSMFSSILALIYTFAFVYMALAVAGFYALYKRSRYIRWHVTATLVVAVSTALVLALQFWLQKRLENDLESKLRSNISPDQVDNPAWKYFHDSFKCCGVTSFFDWCSRTSQNDKRQDELGTWTSNNSTTDIFGTYVCSIPDFCCSGKSCVDLLKSDKIGSSGCLRYIKKEIYDVGLLYKIMQAGSTALLILLSISSSLLFIYFDD